MFSSLKGDYRKEVYQWFAVNWFLACKEKEKREGKREGFYVLTLD